MKQLFLSSPWPGNKMVNRLKLSSPFTILAPFNQVYFSCSMCIFTNNFFVFSICKQCKFLLRQSQIRVNISISFLHNCRYTIMSCTLHKTFKKVTALEKWSTVWKLQLQSANTAPLIKSSIFKWSKVNVSMYISWSTTLSAKHEMGVVKRPYPEYYIFLLARARQCCYWFKELASSSNNNGISAWNYWVKSLVKWPALFLLTIGHL